MSGSIVPTFFRWLSGPCPPVLESIIIPPQTPLARFETKQIRSLGFTHIGFTLPISGSFVGLKLAVSFIIRTHDLRALIFTAVPELVASSLFARRGGEDLYGYYRRREPPPYTRRRAPPTRDLAGGRWSRRALPTQRDSRRNELDNQGFIKRIGQ
jgi:hypothetical protein